MDDLREIVATAIRENMYPWPGCDDADPEGAADAVLAALRDAGYRVTDEPDDPSDEYYDGDAGVEA